EIARALGGTGHIQVVRDAVVLAKTLELGKEEGPAVNDRAAKRAAKVVADELGGLDQREEVAGGDYIAAEKMEKRAVVLVGARSGCNVHYSAARVTEFGRERKRLDLELVHDVYRGDKSWLTIKGDVDRNTIDQHLI